MIHRVLEEKIKEYAVTSALDQENVLQEIVQQVVLASLSRAGIFSKAQGIFHGGTCLRIVHGMNRFSEDLDFFLKRPDPGFSAFPVTTAITTQSLESGFAMKIGAMFFRTYVKGRDWYDFIWYVNK